MEYHLAVFYHAASLFLPRLVAGLITFFIMLGIAFAVQWCIGRIGRKTKRNPYLFDIFATSAKSIVIIIGIIMGLGTIGINVTALVTSLGLAGFALGLAIKDPLSNMISGVMLLYYQPFKVGDDIDVGGKNAGKVVAVSLRYTRLVSEDAEMLIPNNTVLGAVLTVRNQAI
jgi:small conductance mechanosensitive channel